jgi:hypothetical protein
VCPAHQNRSEDVAPYPCPADGRPLFGWVAAKDPAGGEPLILDRCESCGLAVTRAPGAPDVAAELPLGIGAGEDGPVRLANLRSWQGAIGGAQWAGLDLARRRLHLTPDSVRLLASARGLDVGELATPKSPASYRNMVQTLLNAFTLRDNFAREARAGRLRAGENVPRAAYALDRVVTTLLIVPLSGLGWLLETIAARRARGGEMVVRLRRAGAGSDTGDSVESTE